MKFLSSSNFSQLEFAAGFRWEVVDYLSLL